MTVKPTARDTAGVDLDTKVTSLSAAVTASVGKAHNASLSAQLDQAQRELVYHYLDTGRLSAASVLSTMT